MAVFAVSALYAAPRVTLYPKTLVQNSSSVTVSWDANGSPYPATETAKIVYGVSPLNYYGSIAQSFSGSATFTPNTSGMTGGVYYCRVSDTVSNEASYEFVLYVQGNSSVQMSAPINNAALDTLAPQFQWDPVAGTPFYTILVFDTQATIDFTSGSLSITANVIWGATTDQTYITYGSPDPSGYFNKLDPPPLMQGLTYSWIVLNNYDGTPAMMANNVGGTRVFTVNPTASCSAAVLTAPLNNVTITAQPITLTWTAGAGANNYKVVLMKNLTGDTQGAFGSATVPLWSGYTSGTQITIPTDIAMNDGWYMWYVIALDATGRGVKSSPVWDFHYIPTPGDSSVTLQINENAPTGVTSVPNAVVFIDTVAGGDVNVYPLIASDTGAFFFDMQSAQYTFTLQKAGFINAVYTRTVGVAPFADTFIMTRCAYAIRGVVKDSVSGSPVTGALVQASQAGDTYSTNTIPDGSFVVYIPANGSWNINITLAGYQPKNLTAIVPFGALSLNEYILSTTAAPTLIVKNLNTLSGKVTNNLGQGIFAAQVVVSESGNPSNTYPVDTDSSGNYIVNLPDGVWVVNVTKAGFVSPPQSGVSLSGGSAAVRDFTMQAQANTIAGNVKDTVGNAMQGVTVTAASAGNPTVTVLTDVSGNYTLSVGTGAFNVNAVLSGWQYHAPSTQIIVSFASPGLAPSNNNNFILEAAAQPANASALVSVKNGAVAVPGANVTLTGNQPVTLGFTGSGITDGAGSITITALATGHYTMTVVKNGFTTLVTDSGNLLNNVVTLVNAPLVASASTGTFSGATGAGSSTIQVFEQSNPGVVLTTATADGTGAYTTTALPYGDYILKAFKSGYSSSPQQLYVTLSTASSAGNNFTLTAASGGGIVVMAPAMPIYNEGIGGPYQFTASYIDGLGHNIYSVFTWSVNPTAAGTISATGVFTPTSDFIGPITISAAANGATGYASAPVYQNMNNSYGSVTVKDYAGMILSIPAHAASLSNSIGRFTLAKEDVDRSRSSTNTKRVVAREYDLTTGFLFDSSITLTLPITAGQGTGSETIGLWDNTGNTWDDIGGVVSGGSVATQITHFSSYTVLSTLGTIGLAYSENTPNPFSPDRGPILIKYVTDSKVASSVKTTIKIYNMAGKLMRTILNNGLRPVGVLYTDSWDGKDERGRVCLNGRYFLQIEVEDSSGKKQKIYSIALVK